MRYKDAVTLHNEDEVTVKRSKATMQVVEIEVVEEVKCVSVLLTDGNWYWHAEIR